MLKFAVAGAVLMLAVAATSAPALAAPRDKECVGYPVSRKYDSHEVVKRVRNVDHSRVINTRTVVPVRTRVRETNHLVVHENETRHTGVVQHNHLIVEKEIRYVRRVPITTTVNFVTHHYRVVERPAAVSIPVVPRRNYECGLGLGRYQGACRSRLRVRG
jgi:hypothetical protein